MNTRRLESDHFGGLGADPTAGCGGRAAHAGFAPEKGVSAIRAAARAIAIMPLGRIDEETTANVGVIRGGSATNIIEFVDQDTFIWRSKDREVDGQPMADTEVKFARKVAKEKEAP